MKTSENIDQISKAMSIAQGEMNPASKSSINPFYKSTYSSLTQIWNAIREPLSKNQLSVFQDVTSTQAGIAVITRVCHASGQWMEFGPFEISLAKKDAQSLGSATSYGKRYSLSAALGVVSDEEDDDGNKASEKDKKAEFKEEPRITNDQIRYLSGMVTPEIAEKVQAALASRGYDSLADVLAIDFALFESGIKRLLPKEVKQ